MTSRELKHLYTRHRTVYICLSTLLKLKGYIKFHVDRGITVFNQRYETWSKLELFFLENIYIFIHSILFQLPTTVTSVELVLGDKMPSGIFDVCPFVTSQNYIWLWKKKEKGEYSHTPTFLHPLECCGKYHVSKWGNSTTSVYLHQCTLKSRSWRGSKTQKPDL